MTQTSNLAALPALFFASVLLAVPNVSAQNSSEHLKTPGPLPEASAPAAPETQPESSTPPAASEAQPEANAEAPPQGNAVGVAPGWDTNVSDAPPQASQYAGAPDQAEVIEKVNAYFNEMTNIEGDFLQTDPDGNTKKGYFYLERPGKVRFDYNRPSRQKIISNGEYLAIEDHDLKTADRYPLDSTPFRLLLKEKVDLANDADIIAIDSGEDVAVLTLEDKENKGRGQIRLFFQWPEIQLSEWIISDAQGLDTRIQLGELKVDQEADPKLFTFTTSLGLPDFRNGSQ
jgi:outer membrane lipoprotein-sorting protein